MLTGNKGEWSEVYAFFRLLGEGKIYGGDENLHRIERLVYPIIMILRAEGDNYDYKPVGNDVVIVAPDGNVLLRLPATEFMRQAEHLLHDINTAPAGTFPSTRAEEFMNQVKRTKIRSDSTEKADIRIVLHDQRTHIDAEMGFSIKSQLGAPSTLLNASRATNFVYRIHGRYFSDADMERINSICSHEKIKDRYRAIRNAGGKLVPAGCFNETFNNNLRMLDGDMQRLLGFLLLENLESNISRLHELTESLAEKNPLGIAGQNKADAYKFKMKNFLVSVALGLVPNTEWDGVYEANGGYIIVRDDGELLCYHFYDRNRFSDYLLNFTSLERASSTRHKYATLYREGDDVFFDLNLQIRFR